MRLPTGTLSQCGILNLRDLGGYQTKSGKTIRTGELYRSAAILPDSDAKKASIDALQLQTIVDFRSEREKKSRSDYISKNCQYCAHSGFILLDNPDTAHYFDIDYLIKSGRINEMSYYMKDMYRQMAIHNTAYQALFQYIREGRTPLLFHCSSGKDRTGLAAALILLCLGVDEKTVMKDYLLSNQYRQLANQKMIERFAPAYRQKARNLYVVQEAYLEEAFKTILLAYGSFDNYFISEHHLDTKARLALVERYCF